MVGAALSEPLGAPSVVDISDASSTGTGGNGAGVIFSSTGSFYKYFHGVPIELSQWLSPAVNMDQYEIYATQLSGSGSPSGTFGAWTSLATTQEYLLVSGGGTETAVVQIEIRWTGNNEVQGTATYSLSSTA